MFTVEDIEQAIAALPADQLAQLLAWLAEFDPKQWDEQFERDVAAGKLDALADQALADLRVGRCRDL